MIALQIKSTKQIMNALLATETFDSFFTESVSLTTFNTFHIDGHLEKDFYTQEEIDALGGTLPVFSCWKELRPICFSLIKGKKTPVNFRFVLLASDKMLEEITSSPACEVASNLIRSLVLNVRYENGVVTLITGTSFTTFLLDKSVEQLWDNYIKSFLAALQIDFEIL